MNNKAEIQQNNEQILSYPIDDIVAERFGRYAKYIILERALPDVRDGLKPVQRRILYAMNELGLTNDKAYKKAARVVGEVIGKYHPHGDTAVYAAMCRMAQEWKVTWPLVQMQGNKGSIDGDNPAAMRYTEARLSLIAELLLKDIKKNTIHFIKNFDESETEPTVLPAYFPNLLVNGVAGIAVGMATNIPPHNLQEVIDAIIMRINNQQCNLSDLMRIIKGPDFPTGGIIQGVKGIKEAYHSGKGRIAIRAKTHIINDITTPQIIITEIPFEVIKQDLVKKIDDVKTLAKINGIKEVRDETDRFGLRIVIDLTSDSKPQEILNYLFKNTNLQIYYNFNLVAIANKKPVQMNLINMLDFYINHQIAVVTKRSQYDLAQLQRRLEIVNGLVIALSEVDKVIKIIRMSTDRMQAKLNLISAFNFTDIQAEAIVQLRLYRLTATDIQSLVLEKADIENKIIILEEIINNERSLRQVIINELEEINANFSLSRKSQIQGEISEITINEKAMLRQENLFISISYDGWIKVISSKVFSQNLDYQDFGRKPNDIIVAAAMMNNFNNLLFFTNKGNYFLIPIFKLEENKWKDTGIHVNTLCKLEANEKIINVAQVNSFEQPNINIVVVTKYGLIKRMPLLELATTRFNKTSKYVKLKENDSVISVTSTTGHDFIVISTHKGMTLKYLESKVPLLSKTAEGVKALKINCDEDEVVGMACGNSNDIYAMLTSAGSIKRILFNTIEQTSRTTKGNKIIKVPKNKNISIIKTFLSPPTSFINVLTKKEKWLVIKAGSINLSKVNEGIGKVVVEDMIAGDSNLVIDLKTNVIDPDISSISENFDTKENNNGI